MRMNRKTHSRNIISTSYSGDTAVELIHGPKKINPKEAAREAVQAIMAAVKVARQQNSK